jgi:voltage-gated potassium channel
MIFGYSKIAAQIAQSFKIKDYNIIIIEPNPKEYNFAINDNYASEVYNYEFYDDDELIKLGIKGDKIKTLFCLHNDQNHNLFVTLSARNLDKNLQIISLANDTNEERKLKLAGATSTINPYETTGLKIFRQIHRPISLKILDDILYTNSNLEIKEIKITNNCILNKKYFKELTIFQEYNLVLLGIQDKEISNEFIFSSRGINHKIDIDDVVVVLGDIKNIEKFKINIME